MLRRSQNPPSHSKQKNGWNCFVFLNERKKEKKKKQNKKSKQKNKQKNKKTQRTKNKKQKLQQQKHDDTDSVGTYPLTADDTESLGTHPLSIDDTIWIFWVFIHCQLMIQSVLGTHPLSVDDIVFWVLIHCPLMTQWVFGYSSIASWWYRMFWVLIHCPLMTQSESLGIHCQLMTQNVLVLIHCQLDTRLLGYNAWVHVHCQLMTQVFGYSVDSIIIMSGTHPSLWVDGTYFLSTHRVLIYCQLVAHSLRVPIHWQFSLLVTNFTGHSRPRVHDLTPRNL